MVLQNWNLEGLSFFLGSIPKIDNDKPSKASTGVSLRKGRLGKLFALSRRKREMLHEEGWSTQWLFLPRSSLARASATDPKLQKAKAGTGGNEEQTIIGEDQVQDHLRNLNVYKSIHKVLREPTDIVAVPLLIIFEKFWQCGEVLTYWKRRKIITIFKKD